MIRFINILSLITLTLLVGCGVATPRVRQDGIINPPFPPLPTTIPLVTNPPLAAGFRCILTADKAEVVPGPRASVKFTVRAMGAPAGADYIFNPLKSFFNGDQRLVPVTSNTLTATAEASIDYSNISNTGDDTIDVSVGNSINNSLAICSMIIKLNQSSLVLSTNNNKLTAPNFPNSSITVNTEVLGITSPLFSYGRSDTSIKLTQNASGFTVSSQDFNSHVNFTISVTARARDGSSSITKPIVLSFLPALTANVEIRRDLIINGLVTFTVVATTNGITEPISRVSLQSLISFEPVPARTTPNSVTVRFLDAGVYDNSNLRITVTSALRPYEEFNNTPGLNSNILVIPRFTIIAP